MSKDAIKKLQQQLITASDNQWYATTVKLAQQYLELQPDSIKAMLDKGHAMVKLAQYDAALSVFENAIEKLGDQNPDAIYGEIGNLYRDQGDFVRAAEFYQRQIEGDPNDATGRLFLGTLQFQQGRLAEAERTLRDGLACEIGCEEELRYALGCVLRSMGQTKPAKAEFEEVLRIVPKDVLAKNALKDLQGIGSAE